jgi:hypothetical protein
MVNCRYDVLVVRVLLQTQTETSLVVHNYNLNFLNQYAHLVAFLHLIILSNCVPLHPCHHHQFLLLFVADHTAGVKRFHPFVSMASLCISLQVFCFKPNFTDKISIWFPFAAVSLVGYFKKCRLLAYSFWGFILSFIPYP